MSQALILSGPVAQLKAQAARLKCRSVAFWCAYRREAFGLGLLGAATAATLAGAAFSQKETTASSPAPPAPPPLLVRALPKEQALQVNQQIPLASGPNPAAKPFVFKGDAAARARALECLTSAIYYEAGQESTEGQRAVAQVVLNRARHSAFPSTICGVVYQGSTRATGCQFTFTCDGSLYRGPELVAWRRASLVAQAALAGAVHAPVGWATHYHADYVVPYWAPTLDKNAVIGAHIFYRWQGAWGRPAAFTMAHLGTEPNVAALRSAALAAEASTANQTQQASEIAQVVQEIPGAEPIALAPSMRGDKRVAVRFKLAAREAADKAEHKDYVEKFEASDNLRWTLSGEGEESADKPLGRTSAAAPPAVAPAGGGEIAAAAQN